MLPIPMKGHSVFETVRARLSRSASERCRPSRSPRLHACDPDPGKMRWLLRPDLRGHLAAYETGARPCATEQTKVVAGLRVSRRFPGYEPGVRILHYPAAWCGTRELHPHDLLGRQACWRLHQCRVDRVGNAPTCCSRCKRDDHAVQSHGPKSGSTRRNCTGRHPRTGRRQRSLCMGGVDAHPGLAPGRTVLRTAGSTTLPCARKWSGVRVTLPLLPVHSRKCRYYTNTCPKIGCGPRCGQPPWKLHVSSLYLCRTRWGSLLFSRTKRVARVTPRHRNQNGASGRTRTDDYRFTKAALLLLSHGGGVMSEALRRVEWRSHQDLRLEPLPSQGSVQIGYTLGAEWWLERSCTVPFCSSDRRSPA